MQPQLVDFGPKSNGGSAKDTQFVANFRGHFSILKPKDREL